MLDIDEMEFGVSNHRVENCATIELMHDEEFENALDECTSAEDFRDVIEIKLLSLLRDAEVDTKKVNDVAGEFDVDHLTINGYHIDVKYNVKNRHGYHTWIRDIAELLEWITTQAERWQISAMLAYVEHQKWDDVLGDLFSDATDRRGVLERLIGHEESEEAAVQSWSENYLDFDTSHPLAECIDWDKVRRLAETEHDVLFIEDLDGNVSVWSAP